MEIDEIPPERDAALSSSPLSDADSSSGSDSDEQPKIEWLATGRERRSTAGNRMKSMLANEEEPDSDLELLFAEQGDDQGFSDVDAAASDDQMDSSSDEEDNNNNNDAENLEGEKELERQAKERRAAQRKRKAQEAIPVKFRKRVRIDTASTSAATARPKKKSERASWLPAVADMPTRASSRKTTRISKEQLHQQMEEREARRLKQLAQMEKKQAKLEAMKKPPMTQEDRLREAAIVEERNSKSLNRWEAAEKQREEERLAKLAALNNRTLKGPVITFWSGVGRVGDGWLKNEGYHFMIEEKPKRKPKPPKGKDKDAERAKEEDAAKAAEGTGDAPKEAANGDDKTGIVVKQEDAAKDTPAPVTEGQTQDPTPDAGQPGDAANGDAMAVDEPNTTAPGEQADKETAKDQVPEGDKTADKPTEEPPTTVEETTTSNADKPITADGQNDATAAATDAVDTESKPTEESTPAAKEAQQPVSTGPGAQADSQADTANKAQPKAATETGAEVKTEATATPKTESQDVPMTDAAPATQADTTAVAAQPSTASADAPKEGQAAAGTPQATESAQSVGPESVPVSKPTSQLPSEAATPLPTGPEDTSTGEATTRNAIMFQNFHEPAIRDKPTQTMLLFGRKMSKLPKQPPPAICGVTNTLARYRDPVTKIPFATAAAYSELQRLQSSQYQWSKLLGCWVGSGTVAAKGVPERFLRTARCPTLEEVERIAAKKEQRIAAETAEKEKAKELEKAEKEKKKAAAKEKKKGGAASEEAVKAEEVAVAAQ